MSSACAICGATSIAKETLEFPPDKRLCPGDFERCGRPELPMSDAFLTVLRAATKQPEEKDIGQRQYYN